MNHFNGSLLTATLETGEFEPIKDKRSVITQVRPIVDSGTHSVEIGVRAKQADTVSYTSPVSENTSGYVPVRVNSRYHRVRTTITGGFNDASGIKIKVFKAGER